MSEDRSWKDKYVSLSDPSEVCKPSSVIPSVEVSNLGRVRYSNSKKLIVPRVSRHGRLFVNIPDVSKNVSTLVASEFVPNDNGYQYTKHKDGNFFNNRADNIYWSKHKHDKLKPVCCVETGKVFDCVLDLANLLEVNSGLIYHHIRRGTALFGHHYLFVDNNKFRNPHRGVTVMCVETGRKYNSMTEAANDVGIPKFQVESSVHRKKSYKYSFELVSSDQQEQVNGY